MSGLYRISILLLLIQLSLWSQAQLPGQVPASNLRQKTFTIQADSLKIDSLSTIPNTIEIKDIPAADYRFDFINSMLYWIKKPVTETITITYRVFPYKLNPVAQRMNYDSVMNNFYVKPYEFNDGYNEQQRGMFNFGSIKAEGSFGRQIGFGNSQDAVLNSTLNLQLSGMLGDSIEIQAAITDNNIPIQPDGNTQQLNEFDQVFLQFKKKNWQLNLGDLELRQNKSYFLNFYKRLRGNFFSNQ